MTKEGTAKIVNFITLGAKYVLKPESTLVNKSVTPLHENNFLGQLKDICMLKQVQHDWSIVETYLPAHNLFKKCVIWVTTVTAFVFIVFLSNHPVLRVLQALQPSFSISSHQTNQCYKLSVTAFIFYLLSSNQPVLQVFNICNTCNTHS